MGKTTQQTTQSSSPPPQVLQNYQDLVSRAAGVANTPYQQYPGQIVAQGTHDQDVAMQNMNYLYGMTTPYLNQAAAYFNQGASPINLSNSNTSQYVSPWSQSGANAAIGAGQNVAGYGTAAGQNIANYGNNAGNNIANYAYGIGSSGPQLQQYNSQNLQPYLDPYTQSVINATGANIDKSNAIQQNDLLSAGIKAGNAFGGDRAGVAQAELARNQSLAKNQVMAGLQSQGFQNAQTQFNNNNQQALSGQQTALSGLNSGANLGLGAQSTGAQLGLSGLNSGAQLGLSGAQMGTQGYQNAQQLALAQQQAQNQFSANAGTNTANLGNQALNNQLTAAQAQMASGTFQQQQVQNQMNAQYQQWLQQQAYPFQTTQFLGNLVTGTGNASGQNSTTTSPGPSVGSQILGLGAMGLGAYLSDERAKENVEPVGKMFDGQSVYRFNYKGDPRTQMGLIAQNVERSHPYAVHERDGLKMVDYAAATEKAAEKGKFAGGGATPFNSRWNAMSQGVPLPASDPREGSAEVRGAYGDLRSTAPVTVMEHLVGGLSESKAHNNAVRDAIRRDAVDKIKNHPDVSDPVAAYRSGRAAGGTVPNLASGAPGLFQPIDFTQTSVRGYVPDSQMPQTRPLQTPALPKPADNSMAPGMGTAAMAIGKGLAGMGGATGGWGATSSMGDPTGLGGLYANGGFVPPYSNGMIPRLAFGGGFSDLTFRPDQDGVYTDDLVYRPGTDPARFMPASDAFGDENRAAGYDLLRKGFGVQSPGSIPGGEPAPEPFRLDPGAMQKWRNGVDADAARGMTAPEPSAPTAFAAAPLPQARPAGLGAPPLPPQITGPAPQPETAMAYDQPRSLAPPGAAPPVPQMPPQGAPQGAIPPSIGQALMAAGAGMMASRSPTLLGGIGEGSALGIANYAAQQKAYNELDAHPVVDHSGPTTRIYYPSTKQWIDTGIPTISAGQKAANERQKEQHQENLSARKQDAAATAEYRKDMISERQKDREATAERGKWQYLGPAQDGGKSVFMNTIDGTIEERDTKIAAKPRDAKPLPTAVQKDLGDKGSAFTTLSVLDGSFNPKFAGWKSDTVADTMNDLARRGLPSGSSKEAAEWWQDYDRYKAKVRNSLFGSALTKGEISEWQKFDARPSQDPAIVQNNIKRQREIVENGLKRRAESLVKQGYSKEAIEAELGFPIGDVAKKDAAPAKDATAKDAPKVGERKQFKQGWGAWDGRAWVPEKP